MSSGLKDSGTKPRLTPARFGYAVLAAEELTAISNSLKFEYNDGRTFLAWTVGLKVDGAVWIGLFLILATIINLFPVKVRNVSYHFGLEMAKLSPNLLTLDGSISANSNMSLAA
jgi:hypothetical protein